MSFSERVAQLRKNKAWTQQTLAEHVGVKVLQIRRYENGSSQPTLEVIKKMAIALSVTTDCLVFAKDERGPSDDLKLQFEALGQFDEDERKVAKAVLESLILKHNAKRAFVE
ncbi:MAG: helix-turn-helix transcriptional regulator [Gammaproteobacteria bacterium]|nr:helix-turn-helix transcriptional regulator [Gammaproteobacteria bacterium]